MSLNSSQAKCKGYLVWQQDSKGACASTCYGISSAITAGRVDLEEHAASYNPKPEHADFLFSLSCLGSSVYQNSDSSQKGATPPPACLGLEFRRYAQTMLQQEQLQPATMHQHLAPASERDVDFLHSSGASDTGASSGSLHNTSIPASSSNGHRTSPAMPPGMQQQQEEGTQGRPGVLDRLQALHAEVSERLEGQDPWWFGKAFAARAQINYSSMKAMAGEVVTAALVDLGIRQPPTSQEDSQE